MGVTVSKANREMKKKSQNIDSMLNRDQMKDMNSVKMLLLGAGEGGKSTFVKQMQILHAKGFTADDRAITKTAICAQVVMNMHTMIGAMRSLGIRYKQLDSEPAAFAIERFVDQYPDQTVETLRYLDNEITNSIRTLWKDEGIRAAFERRNEFQLTDSAKVFFDDIDRISAADYTPNDQDMLMSRVPTVGIVQVNFTVSNMLFRVFDVAGQKSERRKWIHCFDNVQSVIFVAACSDFDQMMREDHTTNRMTDTLDLYESVVNCVWFKKASMILFLNKKDLFEEKLAAGRSIRTAFPDYTGADDYTESMAYVRMAFEARQTNNKDGFIHETCATDTNQVQLILEGVINHLVNARLSIS